MVKKSESNKKEKLQNVAQKSKGKVTKVKKEKPAQEIVKKEPNLVTAVKKEKKDKKKNKGNPVNPKPAAATNGDDVKPDTQELDAAALAKKEKKKAKKLAKKAKKNEEKEQKKNAMEKSSTQQNGQPKDKKKPTNQKGAKQQKGEAGKERTPRDPTVDAATVFVGNLPISTKRVQIVKLFAKYGGVKGIRLRTAAGQVIFKHKQRKMAGSLNAYVVLKDVETAQKALELNGTEFKGNHLRVTPADAEKSQSGHDAKRTLFVGNLKYSANEKKLHEIFSNCGEIDYIRCLGNGKNGCNGVAYVCFKSPEAVGLALELNETLLDERPIHVERYSVKKLGAKEARDREAAGTQKQKAIGAKKRIDAKNQKQGKQGKAGNSPEKKKKSDYHGVKATGINKKKHNKKPNNEMKGLAKKIAPFIKNEEKD